MLHVVVTVSLCRCLCQRLMTLSLTMSLLRHLLCLSFVLYLFSPCRRIRSDSYCCFHRLLFPRLRRPPQSRASRWRASSKSPCTLQHPPGTAFAAPRRKCTYVRGRAQSGATPAWASRWGCRSRSGGTTPMRACALRLIFSRWGVDAKPPVRLQSPQPMSSARTTTTLGRGDTAEEPRNRQPSTSIHRRLSMARNIRKPISLRD